MHGKEPQVVEIAAALHYGVPHNGICFGGIKSEQLLLFSRVATWYEEETGYRGAMEQTKGKSRIQ